MLRHLAGVKLTSHSRWKDINQLINTQPMTTRLVGGSVFLCVSCVAVLCYYSGSGRPDIIAELFISSHRSGRVNRDPTISATQTFWLLGWEVTTAPAHLLRFLFENYFAVAFEYVNIYGDTHTGVLNTDILKIYGLCSASLHRLRNIYDIIYVHQSVWRLAASIEMSRDQFPNSIINRDAFFSPRANSVCVSEYM